MQHDHAENSSQLVPAMDSLARLVEAARQDDGGPYRSRRDASVDRRERLLDELAILDRAWHRRVRVLHELRMVCAELRVLEPTPQPSRIWRAVAWTMTVGVCACAMSFAIGMSASAVRQPVVVRAPPTARMVVSVPPSAAPLASNAFRDDLLAATMTDEATDTDHATQHLWRGHWRVDPARVPLLVAWSVRDGAQLEPLERDGRPVGMQLSGVSRGGPLARLGLRRGDVLLAVDGIPVRSSDDLLAAYSRVRGAREVVVLLERDGELRTQHYEMR